MSNTKVLALIAFIIIFLLGGVTGYMLAPADEVYPETEQREEATRDDEESSEEGKKSYQQFRDKMRKDLELAENQVEPFFDKIRENRRGNREIIDEHREIVGDKLSERYEIFLEDLGGILDDQQLEKFKEDYGRDALRKRRSSN